MNEDVKPSAAMALAEAVEKIATEHAASVDDLRVALFSVLGARDGDDAAKRANESPGLTGNGNLMLDWQGLVGNRNCWAAYCAAYVVAVSGDDDNDEESENEEE